MLIKINNINTHPPAWLDLKNTENMDDTGKDVEQLDFLYTVSGNTKLYSAIQNQFATFYKVKHALTT